MKKLIFLLFIVFSTITFSQDFWIHKPSPVGSWLTRIIFTDTLYGWASGDSGHVIHTTNGGQNWSRQTTGISFHIDDLFFLNRRLGWAVANDFYLVGSRVLATTNGGTNWQVSVFDTTKVVNTVYFLDSLTGFMGGFSGENFKTTDGGQHWIRVTIDTNYCPYVYLFPKLNFGFASPQIGFASGGHFDIQGMMWRTTDGGLNWLTYCVTPEPVNRVKAISLTKVIATGGDFEYGLNIVQSLNGGTSWLYDTTVHINGIGQALAFRTASELWIPTGHGQTWALSLDSGGYRKPWQVIPCPDSTSVYDALFVTPTFGWACGTNGALLKYNTALIGINGGVSRVPDKSTLYQNFPNPFNPVTTINYYLDKPSTVFISVYDLRGRLVRSSYEGPAPSGMHKYRFASDGLASGVYFYKIQAGNFVQTKKMVLLR